MNEYITKFALRFAFLLGLFFLLISLGNSAEHHVKMINYRYKPETINIKVGDTVTWTNYDRMLHNVKFKKFRSKFLRKGKKFSHTFKEAGSFSYYCTPHRTRGMTGIVIVKE